MIHVLLPPYSPKSIQYIVSAGQIVFELDKKPAVQSLFCKTDFQHCHWLPFNRIPLHFICVCKHRCENPNRLFHIIVSECGSGHLPKKKAAGVEIKGGEFRMDSLLIIAQSGERSLVYRKEGESVCGGEEVALKHGDAYSTWQAEGKQKSRNFQLCLFHVVCCQSCYYFSQCNGNSFEDLVLFWAINPLWERIVLHPNLRESEQWESSTVLFVSALER